MNEVTIDMTFSISHFVESVIGATALCLFVWAVVTFFSLDFDTPERNETITSRSALMGLATVPVALLGTLATIPTGWHDVQPTEESVTRVVDALGGTLVSHDEHDLSEQLENACEASEPSAFIVDISDIDDGGLVKTVAVQTVPGAPCVAKIAKARP